MKKINKILISVYNKSHLSHLSKICKRYNIEVISTGGTKKELEKLGLQVNSVETITEYPSILGGRVKTLHPKIFGGILARNDKNSDQQDLKKFNIHDINMVVVDLYPFQDTVDMNCSHDDIIEKIDIGGVSLIRAAAKNYQDVLVVSSTIDFEKACSIIMSKNGCTELNDRLLFAQKAFNITFNYEKSIAEYFNKKINKKIEFPDFFNAKALPSHKLRYGENPHQKGTYYGELNNLFDQLNGKELSYNNLLDIDAAINLMDEFKESSFGILKHNNACGFASDNNLINAWNKALSGDPISAFGGVLITNMEIDLKLAQKINTLFFEVLIANSFQPEALKLLKSKKNRILLKKKNSKLEDMSFRTVLNGVLTQEKDFITDDNDLNLVSNRKVSKREMEDLIFASKICKHTKSNAIVLVKNKQLLGAGCGQTSRIDALKQAIEKAKKFGFSLENSVMASDAFFPFPDCVEIAGNEKISAVIQPGGSKNDQLSIDYCNANNMAMILTGNRHFKH